MGVTNLVQVSAVWSGFVGAPGYSNFYAESDGNAPASAAVLHSAVHDFFAAVSGNLPAVVRIDFPTLWREFSDANGETIAEGTIGSPAAQVAGSSGAAFAANSGVLIEWLTGQFIAGHRLRGRTYLVPMVGFFGADGTLDATASGYLHGYAQDLLDVGLVNVVWHRPVGGSGGSSAQITAPRVSDTACVLRSRGK